jgi:protein-tyrosine-phosphatase
MAAGFANHYGDDVLFASSAGLAPIPQIPPETVHSMAELNVDVSDHVTRRYDPLEAAEYDIVINMSGYKLPGPPPKAVFDWNVKDPYRSTNDVYRSTRDDLEQRVMRLILDLRKRAARAM